MINFSKSIRGLAVVFVLGTLTSSSAHALRTPSDYLADSWNHYIYFPFLDNIAGIPTIPPASSEEKAKCDNFYSKVKANGEMKITVGIGYYDFSEGEPFSFDYIPDGTSQIVHQDFGMNATIDNTYFTMYRAILLRRCTGNLRVCGFQEESPGRFTKTVLAPDGQSIRAIVELRDSSLTPEHEQNVGPLKDQQTAKSAATTQWFFDSVRTADMVIYNGHSRKGGGPDFNPPRLLDTRHVAYGWYQRNTPGLNRLLAALNGPSKPSALFMMSCNSATLFQAKIKKVAPMTKFAGTNAIIPGDLPTKGALAGMDSFMKFQCDEGFAKEMQSEPALLQQIKPLTVE